MAARKVLPNVADPAAQTYELVPIGRLREHPENPRRGDVVGIGVSIAENGFFGAVLAQRSTRRVIVGNHRLRSARAAGLKRIPVLWTDVDDERALKIMLADNAESDKAEYDPRALADVLGAIVGEIHIEQEITRALAGTGYDANAFDQILEQVEQLDKAAAPATPKEELPKAYIVAIECESEAAQTALKQRLTSEGYKVTARRLGR